MYLPNSSWLVLGESGATGKMVDQDSMVLDFNRVTEIESWQNITDAVIKGVAQSKRKIRGQIYF
jgi:hypothetical protein